MISKIPYDASYDLRIKKDQDYNSSNITINDYFPCSHQSYIHELSKKVLRLRSLTSKNQHEINYESLDDNLLDIINYAAIYYDYIHSQK